MGRSVTSPTTYNVGDTYETSYAPPYGFIPADGSNQLKTAYPALAAAVGDGPLQFDTNGFQLSTSNVPLQTDFAYTSRQNYSLVTDGTKFITTAGKTLWVSDDGLRWKPILYIDTSIVSLGYIQTIKYTGGRWFGYVRGVINIDYLTSTDGETWTKVSPGFAFYDIAFDGTNYVFACNATMRYGTNPLSTTSTSFPGTGLYVEKVGSAHIAWAANATGSVYRSSDNGVTWTLASALYGVSAIYSIANGRLFICTFTQDATARPYWVSTADGTTWTAAGTTFNWSSGQYTSSTSCVVWDGTKYSMGVYSTIADTRIATATSETGAITTYTCTAAGPKYQASMQIAYKTGVYLMFAGGFGTSCYRYTATPAANWATPVNGDTVGTYTVYPLMFTTTYGVWAENKRSTIRGYIGAHDNYAGNTTNYYSGVYIEDSSGYWFPYDFGANVRITSTYGGVSAAPPGVSGALFGTGYFCVSYYSGTNQFVQAYTLNNITKTITTTGAAFNLGNVAISALFSTTKYVFAMQNTSGSSARWDPIGGWVAGTSWGGNFPNNYTSVSGVSYTYAQDIICISGQRTTPYATSYSTDGGLTWTVITPALINTAGGGVTLSAHTMYYYKGQWIVYQGAFYVTTSIGGTTFTQPTSSAGYAGMPISYTSVTNINYLYTDWESYSGTSLCNIGSGRRDLTNGASGAAQIFVYTFPFGSFSSTYRQQNNSVGAYSAQDNFPLGVNTTTYFKVPLIPPTTLSKTMYINAR